MTHTTKDDVDVLLDAAEPIHGVQTTEVAVADGDTAWCPDGGDHIHGPTVVRYSRHGGLVAAVVDLPDVLEKWTDPTT